MEGTVLIFFLLGVSFSKNNNAMCVCLILDMAYTYEYLLNQLAYH